MTAPALRWAVSPRDAHPHAFDAAQLDRWPERGSAQAVCGHPLTRGCPIEVDTPRGAVCAYCAVTLAPDGRGPDARCSPDSGDRMTTPVRWSLSPAE